MQRTATALFVGLLFAAGLAASAQAQTIDNLPAGTVLQFTRDFTIPSGTRSTLSPGDNLERDGQHLLITVVPTVNSAHRIPAGARYRVTRSGLYRVQNLGSSCRKTTPDNWPAGYLDRLFNGLQQLCLVDVPGSSSGEAMSLEAVLVAGGGGTALPRLYFEAFNGYIAEQFVSTSMPTTAALNRLVNVTAGMPGDVENPNDNPPDAAWSCGGCYAIFQNDNPGNPCPGPYTGQQVWYYNVMRNNALYQVSACVPTQGLCEETMDMDARCRGR